MRRLYFIFSTFLLLLWSVVNEPASAQDIEFGVYFGKKEIGFVQTRKEQSESVTEYKVKSEVAYHSWLYNYERTTYLNARYRDGKLQRSYSSVAEDDEPAEKRTTVLENNSYRCSGRGENTSRIDHPIEVSCALLYYREPVGITSIFSEGYQVMCEIKPLGAHTYRLFLPEGKTNDYKYQNGRLVEVTIPRRWFTIYFKRKS